MKDASSSVLNATAVCNNEYVPLLLKNQQAWLLSLITGSQGYVQALMY